MNNNQSRHVQTQLLADVHRRLRDLAYDMNRSIGDLMSDGAILILRHHGRGEGLPTPAPPGSKIQNTDQKEE